MKKFVILLAVASLMATSAFAIVDDGDDSLGCYFDQAYEGTCVDLVANTPFNMYFVLANCQFATIGGFEFQWRFNPEPATAPFILTTTLPPQALNLGDSHMFIVGLGTPYSTGEACVLVTLNMLPTSVFDNTDITVGPAQPASIPNHCAFNDGADPGDIQPMNFATLDGTDVTIDPNGWVSSLGRIGCPGPVASEPTNWSTVKALFN